MSATGRVTPRAASVRRDGRCSLAAPTHGLTSPPAKMRASATVRQPAHGTTAADVMRCEGHYRAYIEDPKGRKGPDADQPHRIAYKKLVRA